MDLKQFTIDELLSDHQVYHSEFQINNFITKTGGTAYGQYTQALRELQSRVKNIRDSFLTFEAYMISIEEISLKLESLYKEYQSVDAHSEVGKKVELEIRKTRIELVRNNNRYVDLSTTLKDGFRELVMFYKHAVILKNKIGELTDETRAKYEIEYWRYKTCENVITDILSTGRLGKGTYEMVNMLPTDMKMDILQTIRLEDGVKALTEKYENKDEIFTVEEVRSLDVNNILLNEFKTTINNLLAQSKSKLDAANNLLNSKTVQQLED